MDLQWIYNLYDHVVNHHFPILSIIQWLRCFSVLKDASWLAEAKIREHLQEPLPYFIEKSRPMHGTTRLHWKGMYFYFLKLGLGRCPVKRCGRLAATWPQLFPWNHKDSTPWFNHMWFPAVPFNPSIDHMTENGRSVGGFRHVLLSIIVLQ